MVLAGGVLLASLHAGGPLVVLDAMALLDFPSGSQQVATDFLDAGGWVLVVGVGLAALGVALYYRRHPRSELPAVPETAGASADE
jgi:membrane protease YdiL (CAAX protease family)